MAAFRDQLGRWMESRIGYGALDASGWFLGLEESCHCEVELDARIRGGALEDLEQSLLRMRECYPHLLTDEPDLQATWRPLMRAWIVASEAKEPTQLELRHYQRQKWGRAGADHLLTELLPLPAPATNTWPYGARFGISRSDYESQWLPQRISLLRTLWNSSRVVPRVAVAYGKSQWAAFRKVFDLSEADGKPIQTGETAEAIGYRRDRIGIILAEHPQSHGIRDEYWNAVGRWLRSVLFGSIGPVTPIVRRRASTAT
jgi:hypothetical protein